MKTIFVSSFIFTTLYVASPSSFGQGALTPPGAPAPTFKTLQQVEPRTPIDETNTPGDADSVFKITQPGSYYLVTNVVGVVGKHGIEILSDAVTVDLMGFYLAGVPGSLDGIQVGGAFNQIAVRDGTVRNWGGMGVNGQNGQNLMLEKLIAVANGADGIRGGSRTIISQCAAQLNGATGLATGTDSVMRDCSSIANTNGIVVTGAIFGCTANANSARGISLGSATTASDCSAFGNGAEGIFCSGSGSVIRHCTSSFNTGDGIHAFGDVLVLENECDSNGQGAGTGAGIHLMTGSAGRGGRIQSNNVTDNDAGIDVDTAGHFIVQNTAQGNTNDYLIAAGNRVGEILVVTNAVTITITNANPWANFRY